MIKRTTLILLAVLLVCTGFLLMLRMQTREEPVPVIRVSDDVHSAPDKVPPGVVRSKAFPEHDAGPQTALRREVAGRSKSGPAGNILPKPSGRHAIPGEFVLSFRDEADWNAFINAAKARGVEIKDSMRFGFSVRVKVKRLEDLQDALNDSPAPVQTSSNYFVFSPEIPGKKAMQPRGDYLPFGNKSLKWLGVTGDNSSWGRGVVVAVMDNGVTSSPMLREDKIARVDFVNEKLSDKVLSGHANAVASIIAGNGGEDMRGLAPDSTLLSIKVLNNEGMGDAFTLAKGIVEAVDRGAGVINMCLGTSGDSYILKNAVDYALSKGVVLVAATGNDGIEGVSYPARYDGVVATSAVDAEGRHLYFANYGKETCISAPGIGITTAWTGSDLVGFSGTSAAVPFVSGAIAYLLSMNPGMKADEAVSTLIKYADDAGAPGKDDIYGNGILNMSRVMDRNQKGIYDIAAGDVYVPPYGGNDKDLKVIISAQNRGTETANSMEIRADLNGNISAKSFSNVAAGQTVSMEIPVNLAEAKKGPGLGIGYEAKNGGATDINPGNNRRQVFVVLDNIRK